MRGTTAKRLRVLARISFSPKLHGKDETAFKRHNRRIKRAYYQGEIRINQ